MAPPGTLSDLLAAEKQLLMRGGPSGYSPATNLGMPTVEDLKILHDRIERSVRHGDGGIDGAFHRAKARDTFTTRRPQTAEGIGIRAAPEVSLLQHAVSHRPSLLQQHGTAVHVSQEGALERHRRRQANEETQRQPCSPSASVSPSRDGAGSWGIASREHSSMRSASATSLRSIGTVAYSTADVRATPSGYRRALKLCHERGGRLSAASIPTQISTQAALDTLQSIARSQVPEFSMLLPDQYHAARQVLRHNRVLDAEASARRAEEDAMLNPKSLRSAAAGGGSCLPNSGTGTEASSPGPWPGGGLQPRAGHVPRPTWSRMSHSGSAVLLRNGSKEVHAHPSAARTCTCSGSCSGSSATPSGYPQRMQRRQATPRRTGCGVRSSSCEGFAHLNGSASEPRKNSRAFPGHHESSGISRHAAIGSQEPREVSAQQHRVGTPTRAANPRAETGLNDAPASRPAGRLRQGKDASKRAQLNLPSGTGGGNLRQIPHALRHQVPGGGATPLHPCGSAGAFSQSDAHLDTATSIGMADGCCGALDPISLFGSSAAAIQHPPCRLAASPATAMIQTSAPSHDTAPLPQSNRLGEQSHYSARPHPIFLRSRSPEFPGSETSRVALGPFLATGDDGTNPITRQLAGQTPPSIPSRPGTAPLLIMTAGGAQPPSKEDTEAAAMHRLKSAPWRGDK